MELNNINNDSLLNDIFEEELVVYEDVQGYKIYVRWDGEDFLIKSDNLNADPINFLDDSIDTFYGKAFNYLNSLNDRIKGLIPKRWWFCFQYFPEPVDTYSRSPKNNLVLSSIIKNNKSEYTVEEIEEFSRLLEVECLPFIFKGKLSEKSIEAIKYFLNTSEDDLEYVFGESNFCYFFYKLLNPQLAQSFLMTDDFNSNIPKIILKINNSEKSFDILNPLYTEISKENKTEYLEIYSLILSNFLNFCQSINFKDLKLKGEKRDEVYTYLISKIFNIYVSEIKEDLLKFDFVVPSFFNKDKFRLNKELLLNKLTRTYIDEEPKIEYVFKCVFFSFKQEFSEPFGVFTKGSITLFNKFVKYLATSIDEYFNKKSEEELHKRNLVNFSDYFDIKYDVDGEDKVYPSIYDEITKGEDKKKKKNGPISKSDIGLDNIKK
jgi:hypothetical protein